MRNKKKKLMLAGLAVAVLAALSVITIAVVRSRPATDSWPDLLTAKPDAPQYNFEVAERDFGYRTGNHVPVSLYFKLKPGMELLSDQMVLAGDFQLVEKTERRVMSGEDTRVKIDLVLQAFVLKPKLEVKTTIAYRAGANSETKKLELLPIEVYTSQTYDGRKDKHPKEPNLAELDGGHFYVTLAFILVGAGGVVGSLGIMLRNRLPRLKKPAPKPVVVPVHTGPYPAGWAPVQEAWAAITGGDRSKAAFTRAAELARTFYGVETLTVSELKESALPEKDQLADFLTVCETAIWADQTVDTAEVETAGKALAALEARMLETAAAAASEPKK